MFGIQKTRPDLLQSVTRDQREDEERLLHVGYEIGGQWERTTASLFVELTDHRSLDCDQHYITTIFAKDIQISFSDMNASILLFQSLQVLCRRRRHMKTGGLEFAVIDKTIDQRFGDLSGADKPDLCGRDVYRQVLLTHCSQDLMTTLSLSN